MQGTIKKFKGNHRKKYKILVNQMSDVECIQNILI